MILMRILPGVLKELSKHVPTVLFQTVEWGDLAHELPKISRRILQKEGYQELYNHYQQLLSPFQIDMTQEKISHRSLSKNKWAAEQILTLYFTQLYSPHGLFLDLRSIHFEANNSSLKWHPSSFWTTLNNEFRLGLLDVYEGFYQEQEELYYRGLTAIGLMQDSWSAQDKKAIADLFRNHFGQALHEEQGFDLDHFQASIIKMSEFMLSKKVKIPKDFLYLGVYLVGLYSSLEESGEKLPVRTIFLRVRDHFQKLSP